MLCREGGIPAVAVINNDIDFAPRYLLQLNEFHSFLTCCSFSMPSTRALKGWALA